LCQIFFFLRWAAFEKYYDAQFELHVGRGYKWLVHRNYICLATCNMDSQYSTKFHLNPLLPPVLQFKHASCIHFINYEQRIVIIILIACWNKCDVLYFSKCWEQNACCKGSNRRRPHTEFFIMAASEEWCDYKSLSIMLE
jgi:hypothetical protein